MVFEKSKWKKSYNGPISSPPFAITPTATFLKGKTVKQTFISQNSPESEEKKRTRIRRIILQKQLKIFAVNDVLTEVFLKEKNFTHFVSRFERHFQKPIKGRFLKKLHFENTPLCKLFAEGANILFYQANFKKVPNLKIIVLKNTLLFHNSKTCFQN